MSVRSANGKFIGNARRFGGTEKIFATRAEAKDYVRSVEAEISRNGTYINPKKTPTFAEAVKDFIQDEKLKLRKGLIGSAHLRNKEVALLQAAEVVGDMRVGDLRPSVTVKKIKPVYDSGSVKTLRNKISILKELSKWCLERDYCAVNFADITVGAAPKAAFLKPISKDIINKIIKVAEDKYRPHIVCAALTGMRASEQIALEWSDVAFSDGHNSGESGAIYIEKALKKKDGVREPKTRHGVRRIPMSLRLRETLEEWRENQPVKQRQRGLVFPSREGNYASVDNWRNRGLHKACDRAGVDRIRWHDLRHYFASVLIFGSKCTVTEVAKLLGHSSVQITYQIYGHWMEDSERDRVLAQKMDAAFS